MMEHRLIDARKIAATAWQSERSRPPPWWRALGYLAAVLPLLVFAGLAWLWPDFNRPPTPDWKSVLARAEASAESGDFYRARHLYVQVDMIAGWRREWRGLVAAACGINRLGGAPGPYSQISQILLRALITARRTQSRQGIETVAKAFAVIGEPKAAEMALAQVRSEWPAEKETDVEDLVAGCRAPRHRKEISATDK